MMSGIKDKKNEKNRGNMRTAIRKMTAVVTAAGLAFSMAAMPEAGERAAGENAAGDGVQKEETVYIFTDASGRQKSVVISDWLKNTGALGTIADRSDLENIENVKGDESFAREGRDVIWNASGHDIYYQGESTNQPPVDVRITYTLDGREVQPQELGGASGHLKMRYDYVNRAATEAEIDGKKETVYVPFGVISGCLFTDGCASNVTVSSGKVLDEGGNVAVVGLAFPGLQDSLKLEKNQDLRFEELNIPQSVEIEADVENFSMEMNMSLILDDALDEVLGLFDAGSDLDQITEDVDKLETASSELAEGSEDLYEGMTELDEGAGSLDEGVKKYTEGVGKAYGGSKDLTDGASKLDTGAGELAAGAKTLHSGASTLNSRTGELTAGSDALSKGIEAVRTAVTQLAAGMRVLPP